MTRAAPVRLTVLGSGTLVPSKDHHSSAHFLEAGGFRCLLDCGAGTVHGFDRHGVDWKNLDVVAFSHYHTDHVGDLPALLFALKHGVRPARTRPLRLLGPPGLADRLRSMAEAFGDHLRSPGFPLWVEELDRNGSWEAGGIRLTLHPTPHTDASVAQRWETGGRVVAYTGDTGPPGERLLDFLTEVDVLVSEVSLPDSTKMSNHMTPARAAAMALRTRPKLLVTTHAFPPLDPARVPEEIAAAGYGGRVEAATDGMMVIVGDEIAVRWSAPDERRV